jgi:hypothetical protein
VVLGEAPEDDVDRALPVVDLGIVDVGKDATLRGLLYERGVGRVEENNHRAGGFLDDLLDESERMLGAPAKPDEGDVGSLTRSHRTNLVDFDLACDHFVPKSSDDRHDERKAILTLVRDQNAEMLGFAIAHLPAKPCRECSAGRRFDGTPRW